MTLDAYEAMPTPQPRQDLDAGMIVRPCSGSTEGMTTWRIEDEPKKLEDAIEDNDELDEL